MGSLVSEQANEQEDEGLLCTPLPYYLKWGTEESPGGQEVASG
jgi:hypothetical protein